MPSEETTYRAFVKETLTEIREQTKKTNGRVTTLETNIKIVAAVVAVIVILKFPELVGVLKSMGI